MVSSVDRALNHLFLGSSCVLLLDAMFDLFNYDLFVLCNVQGSHLTFHSMPSHIAFNCVVRFHVVDIFIKRRILTDFISFLSSRIFLEVFYFYK